MCIRDRALTGLEREKLVAEYKELMAQIAQLKAILADEKKLRGVIREEIIAIADKYGDDRKTEIGYEDVYKRQIILFLNLKILLLFHVLSRVSISRLTRCFHLTTTCLLYTSRCV